MNEWDIVIKSLKDHGRVMIAGMVAGLIAAVLVTVFQTPVWEARMTVAPTTRTGILNLSSVLPRSAADTPMLQYFVDRIDAATSSDFALFQTLIDSPRLARRLIGAEAGNLPEAEPSDLTAWLNEHVRVRNVGATPFRRITLRHHDPVVAVNLLERLYAETDMVIRQDMQAKTARRIAYLKEELQKTFHPDHRDALIALLKEQEQTAMMVSIDRQFAAEAVDPPSVGDKPVAPDWRLIFPVFIACGAIFGLMLGGFMQAFYRHSR